jgi:hypothetical protein
MHQMSSECDKQLSSNIGSLMDRFQGKRAVFILQELQYVERFESTGIK